MRELKGQKGAKRKAKALINKEKKECGDTFEKQRKQKNAFLPLFMPL